MIHLLVITDGRRSCISRSIPSALAMLEGPITNWTICDDSADPDYNSWLRRTFPDFDIISGPARLGFGGNIQRAWAFVAENSSAEYVFHLEDDFTFNRVVPLREMMSVLSIYPSLVQLALRRQPWNTLERAAGGVIEQFPEAYTERHNNALAWLEHRLFFTTNPSLYRASLCRTPWPDGSESEGHFTHELLTDPEIRFGFWGARDSGEWVTHIGNERVGNGY